MRLKGLKHSDEELNYKLSLPLGLKIALTRQTIQEWYEYWEGKVYVSFSGGKDSTVLLHLVRELYPDVQAVFIDTMLEYPEIREFVKTFENVKILKPCMTFKQVLIQKGYPLISKEVSETIDQARKSLINGKYTYRLDKINGVAIDKNGNLSKYNHSKYKCLMDAPFKISNQCCNIMKKNTAHKYEKETGNKPFVGEMTEESVNRRTAWKRTGCNGFDSKKPKSKPLSFWTQNDILTYIKQNNLPICSVYGEVNCTEDYICKCSGCQRSGCVFCGFGLLQDKQRFLRLKETHPKLYDYCMSGGGITLKVFGFQLLMDLV